MPKMNHDVGLEDAPKPIIQARLDALLERQEQVKRWQKTAARSGKSSRPSWQAVASFETRISEYQTQIDRCRALLARDQQEDPSDMSQDEWADHLRQYSSELELADLEVFVADFIERTGAKLVIDGAA